MATGRAEAARRVAQGAKGKVDAPRGAAEAVRTRPEKQVVIELIRPKSLLDHLRSGRDVAQDCLPAQLAARIGPHHEGVGLDLPHAELPLKACFPTPPTTMLVLLTC
jgi:hypothetical protein